MAKIGSLTKDHHASRVLPVPIRRVAEVLSDPGQKPEWVSKLGEEVVLEKKPERARAPLSFYLSF